MAEPIEMSFGLWTRVDPRNHVLDVGPDSPKRRDNVWGKDMLVHVRRQSAVSCAKKWLNRPISRLGCVDSGSKESCVTLGARWRHLANTLEKSMCGGDAAFLSNYVDYLFN